MDGVTLHGEGVVFADPYLPRQSAGAFKQFVEGLRMEFSKADEDPLRIAEVDIGEGNRLLVAEEGHSAVDGLQSVVSQSVDLLAEKMLKSKKTGGNES